MIIDCEFPLAGANCSSTFYLEHEYWVIPFKSIIDVLAMSVAFWMLWITCQVKFESERRKLGLFLMISNGLLVAVNLTMTEVLTLGLDNNPSSLTMFAYKLCYMIAMMLLALTSNGTLIFLTKSIFPESESRKTAVRRITLIGCSIIALCLVMFLIPITMQKGVHAFSHFVFSYGVTALVLTFFSIRVLFNMLKSFVIQLGVETGHLKKSIERIPIISIVLKAIIASYAAFALILQALDFDPIFLDLLTVALCPPTCLIYNVLTLMPFYRQVRNVTAKKKRRNSVKVTPLKRNNTAQQN